MHRIFVVMCSAVVSATAAFAGDLNPPPGPVAPTLKTLVEVEPRTAINVENTPGNASSVFVIARSGSYYLTENILAPAGVTGILVTADDVTIDLVGFTIFGTLGGASADGINADNRDRIHIRNGRVRLFTDDGIVTQDEARLENLDVTNCQGDGINTGSSSNISNCTSVSNTGRGFVMLNRCIVERCTARFNGTTGFAQTSGCLLTDCVTNANTGSGFTSGADATYTGCQSINDGGTGFFGTHDATLTSCVAESAGTIGFDFDDRLTMSGCRAADNAERGISAANDATVRGCVSSGNGQGGIELIAGGSVVGCTVDGNGRGIFVSTEVLISGCAVSGNAGVGIRVFEGCAVIDNLINGNDEDGIWCASRSLIRGNTCRDNGNNDGSFAGMKITGNANRVEGNHLVLNPRGITMSNGARKNIIVRNSTVDNDFTNTIVPDNEVAPFVGSPVGAGPWDNFNRLLGT